MRKILKRVLTMLFRLLYLDRFLMALQGIIYNLQVERYNRFIHGKLHFIRQGEGGVTIEGDLSRFSIHETSHLKAATYVECNGGVTIGRYFHCGRGLTLLSTNHKYEGAESIPYDSTYIKRPVIIEDFVWCGANVTIAPGVTISEGAVIGCGSVVTKDVPRCAVVGGNPSKVIKLRDIQSFNLLKSKGCYY